MSQDQKVRHPLTISRIALFAERNETVDRRHGLAAGAFRVYAQQRRSSWRRSPVHGEPLTRRSLFATAGLGALAALSSDASEASEGSGASGLPAPDPLVHLVNRITFGASPGDLARARELGFEGFVEEQLHPEAIDDSAVEAEVRRRFPTVSQSGLALEDHPRLRVAAQLKSATLWRALASPRQLFEMMVDFWSNHFNVHHLDGPCAYYKTVEDRELIRRHALGSFRDLLNGSAKSPAMIVYLDNFTNSKESPNENYARELMELHTLGVDGGFTQDDVEEVARAFTGWTLDRLAPESRRDMFFFDPARHDDGARSVLGTAIPAGLGIGHGERVLDILAAHPATARFLAFKLCRRFVADDPPPALVERAAATFTATDGDIREVMRTILLSAELGAAPDRKLKRPFEFLVSALRILGARLTREALPALLSRLEIMGQLPFNWPPPNGYPDTADVWGTTNGLLDRFNLALALGAESLPGVAIDVASLTAGLYHPTPAELADHLAERLLARPLAQRDHRQVIRILAAGGSPAAPIPESELRSRTLSGMALLLGSPYFQWR
jgi:hypothetical protein